MKSRFPKRYIEQLFPGLVFWSNLPAFTAFIAFATGITVAAFLPVIHYYSLHLLYLIVQTTAIICLISGVLCRRKAVLFTCFFIAGICWTVVGTSRDSAQYQELTRIAAQGDRMVSGVIVTTPAPESGMVGFLIKVTSAGDSGTERMLKGRLLRARCDAHGADIGDTMLVMGTLKPPRMQRNPFEFNERAYLSAGGIAGTLAVTKVISHSSPTGLFSRFVYHLREKINRTLKQYRKTLHRHLVRAAFLGEKDFLSQQLRELFTQSGLSHLLALSGLHAGIILSAVYVLFSFMPFRKEVRHIAAALVLWGYLLFVGPLPSLTRATIMATAVIVTMLFQRKQYPIQSLGVAGIVWLVCMPSALFQAGFQLSFLATAGILLLFPRLVKWCPQPDSPVAAYLLRLVLYPFFVSLSVFVTTVPVLLYHFGTLSFYSLFANIIAVPLMTAGMWLFFCALVLPDIFPVVNQFPLWLSGICFDGLVLVARGVEAVPWTAVRLPVLFNELCIAWYVIIMAIASVKKKHAVKVLTGGLLVLFCMLPAGYIVRRSVGKPQCIRFATESRVDIWALKWRDGKTWLFCSGKPFHIRRAIHHTVEKWVRHTPEVKVEHVFTMNETHSITDSNTVSGRKDCYSGDTLVVHNSSRKAYVCQLYHDNRGSVLSIKDAESMVVVPAGTHQVLWKNGDREEVLKMVPPYVITLNRNKLKIRPFKQVLTID